MSNEITKPVQVEKALPKVVALVPAWNAEEFIEKTLDSLAVQSYSNIEILISNDASTDSTGLICDQYALRDARFKVIHQLDNLGWIGNVNALFAAAEGDYYFFAFHDDLVTPDYVDLLVEALERDQDAILAFTDMELVMVEGKKSYPVFDELDGRTDIIERLRVMAIKPRYNWVPNRGLFRAWAPERVGGLRKNLAGEFVADWPWLLSLLTLGHFVRVPGVKVLKYYKEESVSVRWETTPFQRAAVIISCCQVIRRAHISTREKWTLYLVPVRSYPLEIWSWIRRKLSRQPILRRIYFALKNGDESGPG